DLGGQHERDRVEWVERAEGACEEPERFGAPWIVDGDERQLWSEEVGDGDVGGRRWSVVGDGERPRHLGAREDGGAAGDLAEGYVGVADDLDRRSAGVVAECRIGRG